MQKKTRILVIGAVLLLFGLAAGYLFLGPKAVEGSKTLTLKVDHLEGEDTEKSVRTDAEFLREVVEEELEARGEESEYGLYLLTVDGETADESRQQWWSYTVDGEFAMNGVDTQPVCDGEVYVFTLMEGYDDAA